jgi:hypothetical protein
MLETNLDTEQVAVVEETYLLQTGEPKSLRKPLKRAGTWRMDEIKIESSYDERTESSFPAGCLQRRPSCSGIRSHPILRRFLQN